MQSLCSCLLVLKGGTAKDASQITGTIATQRCKIEALLQPFASFLKGTTKDSFQLTNTVVTQRYRIEAPLQPFASFPIERNRFSHSQGSEFTPLCSGIGGYKRIPDVTSSKQSLLLSKRDSFVKKRHHSAAEWGGWIIKMARSRKGVG